MKNLAPKKTPGTDRFTGKLEKFQGRIIDIFHKPFQQIGEEAALLNSSCKISIILIPKLNKEFKRKKQKQKITKQAKKLKSYIPDELKCESP